MGSKKKLLITREDEIPILKKNLSLKQIDNKIKFDESILGKGLVMILEKELEMTDRIATSEEIEQHAIV